MREIFNSEDMEVVFASAAVRRADQPIAGNCGINIMGTNNVGYVFTTYCVQSVLFRKGPAATLW